MAKDIEKGPFHRPIKGACLPTDSELISTLSAIISGIDIPSAPVFLYLTRQYDNSSLPPSTLPELHWIMTAIKPHSLTPSPASGMTAYNAISSPTSSFLTRATVESDGASAQDTSFQQALQHIMEKIGSGPPSTFGDSLPSFDDTEEMSQQKDVQEQKADDLLVKKLTDSMRSAVDSLLKAFDDPSPGKKIRELIYAQDGIQDSQKGFHLDKEKFDGHIDRLIGREGAVQKAREILGDPDFCPDTIDELLSCIDEAKATGDDPSLEKRGLNVPEDVKDGFMIVGMIFVGTLASAVTGLAIFCLIVVSACLLIATGLLAVGSLERLLPKRFRSRSVRVEADVELQDQAPGRTSGESPTV